MSDYTLTTDDVRNNHRAGIPSSQFSKSDGLFDRWLAAHDAEVAAKVLDEVAADVESSKPVQDGSELRQWMAAGIDRALFRIRAAEYRKTEAEGK